MSSGPPDPPPPSSSGIGDDGIPEAVDQLKKLVRLGETANKLAEAQVTLLSGSRVGGGRGSSGAGTGPDLTALFDRYFGRGKATGPSMGSGLGGWLRHKYKMAGRNRVQRWSRAAGRAGRGLGRTLGLSRGAAGGLGRVAAGVGAAAGAVATVVGVAVAVATALKAFYEAVDAATEAQMKTAKRLSEVEGGMAAVVAQREIGQIMRDVKRGQETSGTAQTLMESESRRKEQENKLAIVFDNGLNRVLTILNDGIADVLEPIAEAVTLIAKAIGLDKPPLTEGGVAGMERDIREAARADEVAGRRLMEIARRKAAAAGAEGFAGRPPGRLP